MAKDTEAQRPRYSTFNYNYFSVYRNEVLPYYGNIFGNVLLSAFCITLS